MQKIILVPLRATPAALEKVAKVNKRLAHNGLETFTFEYKEGVAVNGQMFTRFTFELPELLGLGFKLIGRIEIFPEENVSNLVFMYDGNMAPERYLRHKKGCDHCGINRYRKQAYIVRDAHGIEMVVGSSCMEVATGLSLSNITYWDNAIRDISEMDDEYFGMAPIEAYKLQTVVAMANRLVAVKGFISRSYAVQVGCESTGDQVIAALRKEIEPITAQEIEDAQLAIALAGTNNATNNFMQNVSALAERDYITAKEIGIAAFFSKMFWDEKTKSPAVSNHFGTAKQRFENVAVEVTKIFRGYSDLGSYEIITFRSDDGNVMVWKTSTNSGMTVGEKFAISFSIKNHTDYMGVKQTNILRVKKAK